MICGEVLHITVSLSLGNGATAGFRELSKVSGPWTFPRVRLLLLELLKLCVELSTDECCFTLRLPPRQWSMLFIRNRGISHVVYRRICSSGAAKSDTEEYFCSSEIRRRDLRARRGFPTRSSAHLEEIFDRNHGLGRGTVRLRQ